jgi:hypothetical protein
VAGPEPSGDLGIGQSATTATEPGEITLRLRKRVSSPQMLVVQARGEQAVVARGGEGENRQYRLACVEVAPAVHVPSTRIVAGRKYTRTGREGTRLTP